MGAAKTKQQQAKFAAAQAKREEDKAFKGLSKLGVASPRSPKAPPSAGKESMSDRLERKMLEEREAHRAAKATQQQAKFAAAQAKRDADSLKKSSASPRSAGKHNTDLMKEREEESKGRCSAMIALQVQVQSMHMEPTRHTNNPQRHTNESKREPTELPPTHLWLIKVSFYRPSSRVVLQMIN